MPEITADMLIGDVLMAHPRAAQVFARYGLACAACCGAGMETLSAVASMHDVDTDALLAELRALAEEEER